MLSKPISSNFRLSEDNNKNSRLIIKSKSNAMKKFILSLSILYSAALLAQVPLDKTVYDCNSNSKTIQNTLGTGKAIIIAHEGVDCSICQSKAPALQTWANSNKVKVEVWAAMTYKYDPNTFSNDCQATNNWVNTYNWTDIFTFPDSNRAWVQNATPTYYVYSPIDSSIIYQGTSETTAQSRAISASTVGLNDNILEKNIKLFYNGENLVIENTAQEIRQIELRSITGKLVSSHNVGQGENYIDLNKQAKGIYFVQFKGNNKLFGTKKVSIY
jgi:hypothetical protein